MTDSQFDCDTATGQELAGAVADYIEEHGWTRGALTNDRGEVCFIGGIAGVCVNNPHAGYELLQGRRGSNVPKTTVPNAIIELVQALRPVLHSNPVRTFQKFNGGTETVVSDSPLIRWNDFRIGSKDQIVGILRQVQEKGAVDA